MNKEALHEFIDILQKVSGDFYYCEKAQRELTPDEREKWVISLDITIDLFKKYVQEKYGSSPHI